MPQPTESQIRQMWKVQGEPQGIPYPDFKAEVLAQGGGALPWSPSKPTSGTYAPRGSDTGTGGEAFLGFLAQSSGADIETPKRANGSVGAAAGDGTLDYYNSESARIDAALKSPTVSNERKAELKQAKADLDDQYFGVRSSTAGQTLRDAGSDADALAALQALEGLRTTTGADGGIAGGGASGPETETIPGWGTRPKQTVDQKLAGGLPVYDPWDEARAREEWVNDGFQARGMSFEEYKQEVLKVNPNGALRYTSPTAKNLSDGRAKTYIGSPDPRTGGPSAGSADRNKTAVRNAEITRDASLGYYDNITQRALQDLGSSNRKADEEAKQILSELAESGRLTKQQTNEISQKLTREAESSNAESRASSQRLTAAVDRMAASNQQGFSDYQAGIAPYQHQLAGTTRQNVEFDPEGLAAQRAALQQAQGIAGGSLDYRSQAAQAYANADDVARSLEGLEMLRSEVKFGGTEQRRNLDMARHEYATGGAQQQNILDRTLRELDTGGANQQKVLDLAFADVKNGGARQREVYDKYKSLSNPEMTAAERAILAQSQRYYANQDKANRDAVSRDLEDRGVMSGAGLIAGQQAAQQRLGEERVAGTLGAQGEAVRRAFSALQGMETSSNSLRAGDQAAIRGAGQAADSLRAGQQAALGLAGRAATDLRTGNQNAQALMQQAADALRAGDQRAAEAFTAAAQEQRAQGFQEEYSRGVAADNASANNQSTRLGGAQLQSSQANAIRSANDTVNMFNNEQQGLTDRFNADYAQREYDRLAGLQQNTFDNRQTTIRTDADLEFGLDDSNQRAIDGRYGRTSDAARLASDTAFGNFREVDMPLGRERLVESREQERRRTGEIDARVGTAKDRITLGRNANKDVEDALFRL